VIRGLFAAWLPRRADVDVGLVIGVYCMRMARVNITVPDEVLARARAAGLNVSRVAATALVEELARQAKRDALATYLQELGRELGPVSAAQQREAVDWADQIFGTAPQRGTATPRTA